jgi:hypothetical protein
MRQVRSLVSLLLAAVSLAACTYDRGDGPPQVHFAEFRVAPPEKNTVEVCHAYTCSKKTTFYFRPKDIKDIELVMRQTKKGDTPFQERRAIAYAIAMIEKKVGTRLGIKDRAGMEFGGTGDASQQDCVDEATNTTSYLMVLQSHRLLKYHTVVVPMTKGALLKATLQGDPVKYWPHWTAVIQEKKTGQRFAVDSWIYPNGENPAVVEVEKWYIKDLNNLPKATN